MKESQFIISAEVLPGGVIATHGIAGILVEGETFSGYPIRALWDTGANTSAISEEIADLIKPEFLRKHSVDTAHDGPTELSSYSNVSFMLADGLVFTPRSTDVVNLEGQRIDAIIGMDIISQGTLLIEPTEGGCCRFTFTYEL